MLVIVDLGHDAAAADLLITSAIVRLVIPSLRFGNDVQLLAGLEATRQVDAVINGYPLHRGYAHGNDGNDFLHAARIGVDDFLVAAEGKKYPGRRIQE